MMQNIWDGKLRLHDAVCGGDVCCVKEVLECGEVNVNEINDSEETALHVALRQKKIHFEIVKLLVENGVNVNLQDKYGDNSLFVALNVHNEEELQHSASQILRFEIADFLLRNGANINSENKYGHSLFYLALENQLHDIALYALHCGCDIRKQNAEFVKLILKFNLPHNGELCIERRRMFSVVDHVLNVAIELRRSLNPSDIPRREGAILVQKYVLFRSILEFGCLEKVTNWKCSFITLLHQLELYKVWLITLGIHEE